MPIPDPYATQANLVPSVVSPSQDYALASTHSLQAYIELVFMNAANNLVFNKMLPLQSALLITQASINVLTVLQNLHNMIQVNSVGSFATTTNNRGYLQLMTDWNTSRDNQTFWGLAPNYDLPGGSDAPEWQFYSTVNVINSTHMQFNYNAINVISAAGSTKYIGTGDIHVGGISNDNDNGGIPAHAATVARKLYLDAYQHAASAFFNSPVGVHPSFSTAVALSAALTQFVSARTQLSTVILPLLSIANPNAAGTANSLYATLKTVLTRMNKVNVAASRPGGSFYIGTTSKGVLMSTKNSTSFGNWLVDGYNTSAGGGAVSAGAINQDIVSAITAAESMNTSQTEQVRSYLLLYQQYYQTAAAMLKQITSIIQQMTQNMGR